MIEMMEATLPENVTVVIETGGAAEWMNEMVDASVIQRYVYSIDEITLVDEQEQANMGDPEHCRISCPSVRQIIRQITKCLFWDHGGGSICGAACDEYGYDA